MNPLSWFFKVTGIHPKVSAATIGAIVGQGINFAAAHYHIQIPPPVQASIPPVIAALLGWLAPGIVDQPGNNLPH